MGQWVNRAHMIWAEDVTGNLEQDFFVDISSMTVDESDAPSLDELIARGGLHEPASGGGVVDGVGAGPDQHTDAVAAFGGQLQAPGVKARKGRRGGDGGGDGFAAQALGQGPKLVDRLAYAQEKQAVDGEHGRHRRWVELAVWIGPDDGAAVGGRGIDGRVDQQKSEESGQAVGLAQDFMDGAASKSIGRQQVVQDR